MSAPRVSRLSPIIPSGNKNKSNAPVSIAPWVTFFPAPSMYPATTNACPPADANAPTSDE